MHLMTLLVTDQQGCQQQTSPFRRVDGVHRRDNRKEHIWYCLQGHIGGWQPSCSQEIKRKKITKGQGEFKIEIKATFSSRKFLTLSKIQNMKIFNVL